MGKDVLESVLPFHPWSVPACAMREIDAGCPVPAAVDPRDHTSVQVPGLLHSQCVGKLNLCPSDCFGPPGCPEPLEVGTVLLLPSELFRRCPAAHGAQIGRAHV